MNNEQLLTKIAEDLIATYESKFPERGLFLVKESDDKDSPGTGTPGFGGYLDMDKLKGHVGSRALLGALAGGGVGTVGHLLGGGSFKDLLRNILVGGALGAGAGLGYGFWGSPPEMRDRVDEKGVLQPGRKTIVNRMQGAVRGKDPGTKIDRLDPVVRYKAKDPETGREMAVTYDSISGKYAVEPVERTVAESLQANPEMTGAGAGVALAGLSSLFGPGASVNEGTLDNIRAGDPRGFGKRLRSLSPVEPENITDRNTKKPTPGRMTRAARGSVFMGPLGAGAGNLYRRLTGAPPFPNRAIIDTDPTDDYIKSLQPLPRN